MPSFNGSDSLSWRDSTVKFSEVQLLKPSEKVLEKLETTPEPDSPFENVL